MSAESLKVPAVAAVVVACRRQLDGDTHHHRVRIPVKTAWQTNKALANGRDLYALTFSRLLVEARPMAPR
jgi:hypothetical protein